MVLAEQGDELEILTLGGEPEPFLLVMYPGTLLDWFSCDPDALDPIEGEPC